MRPGRPPRRTRGPPRASSANGDDPQTATHNDGQDSPAIGAYNLSGYQQLTVPDFDTGDNTTMTVFVGYWVPEVTTPGSKSTLRRSWSLIGLRLTGPQPIEHFTAGGTLDCGVLRLSADNFCKSLTVGRRQRLTGHQLLAGSESRP